MLNFGRRSYLQTLTLKPTSVNGQPMRHRGAECRDLSCIVWQTRLEPSRPSTNGSTAAPTTFGSVSKESLVLRLFSYVLLLWCLRRKTRAGCMLSIVSANKPNYSSTELGIADFANLLFQTSVLSWTPSMSVSCPRFRKVKNCSGLVSAIFSRVKY